MTSPYSNSSSPSSSSSSPSHGEDAFFLSRRLYLDERVFVWGVLAVEVVVVGLRGRFLDLVLGAVVIVLPLCLRAIVGAFDSASVVGSQKLVHRVVRCIFVLGVGNDIAVLELIVSVIVVIITIPRRGRLFLSCRLDLDERVLIWGVLAVEVVVVSFRGRFLNLVFGAVIVVLPFCLRAIVGAFDSASVVSSQKLVHRIVRCVLVFGMSNDIAVLELIVPVIVVIITIPRRGRLFLSRRLDLDER